MKYNNEKLSSLSLINIEALAFAENDNPNTWQVGSKKIISTTSPGWTFDISGGFWLFNGKKQPHGPSTSETTIKCCRAQGELHSCPYEMC